jgi:hypothetical protein
VSSLPVLPRHRDESQPDQWPIPKSRVIKQFVYLSDVAADGGPLAVVRRAPFLPPLLPLALCVSVSARFGIGWATLRLNCRRVRRCPAATSCSTARGRRVSAGGHLVSRVHSLTPRDAWKCQTASRSSPP